MFKLIIKSHLLLKSDQIELQLCLINLDWQTKMIIFGFGCLVAENKVMLQTHFRFQTALSSFQFCPV